MKETIQNHYRVHASNCRPDILQSYFLKNLSMHGSNFVFDFQNSYITQKSMIWLSMIYGKSEKLNLEWWGRLVERFFVK